MFLVCGEALMDVFAQGDTETGMALDARIGGSPLNVAIGLARLGQRVQFLGGLSRGFLGDRLRRALVAEGVDLTLAASLDAPTTLSLVGLDACGSASYAFYGEGCADRMLQAQHLVHPRPEVLALHFGSYTMVVEPTAGTQRLLIEQTSTECVISYDPNIRLNVEPDRARWVSTADWMARRAHVFKVSSEDLEQLYPGKPARAVADGWLALGVRVVVVTRGSEGALAFTHRDAVGLPASPVAVVDTVGAGDSFQAAMLCWLAEQNLLSIHGVSSLSGERLLAMLGFASNAAAITCTRRGAELPRRLELPPAPLEARSRA